MRRPHRFTKTYRTRDSCCRFQLAPALLLNMASALSLPCTALADDTPEDLRQLREAIRKELGELKKREQKLQAEFLRLDKKSQLFDEKLRQMPAGGARAEM